MNDLYKDYITGAAPLQPLFSDAPGSLFLKHQELPCPEGAFVDELNAYQRKLGGAAVYAGEQVVVTGQQAGLFTGPLYTIYKALTAISAARRLPNCRQVFWVSGDDHDFEEARVTHILTKDHEDFALRYDPQEDIDSFPLFNIPITKQLHTFADQFAAAAPGSEHREKVLAFLHESLTASSSFSDWNARMLARLFRDTPLVIFSPDLPEARKLAAPVLRREIEHPLHSTRLVIESAATLSALGYEPQLLKGEDECNFFVLVDRRRRKVLFQNEQFHIVQEQQTLTRDEMLAWLERAPGDFSPNVALRCIVQQHTFPTVAYVGGPGEVAYWAQLKSLFSWHNLPMPIVYPRAQGALSNTKLNKLLKKFGLAPADLLAAHDVIEEAALRQTQKTPAMNVLEKHKKGIIERAHALQHEIAALRLRDKAFENAAKAAAWSIGHTLERLEQSFLRGDATQVAAVKKQVDRLATVFAPDRKPQERVYNIFSFLFEHGFDLIPRLLEEIDITSFAMNVVEL